LGVREESCDTSDENAERLALLQVNLGLDLTIRAIHRAFTAFDEFSTTRPGTTVTRRQTLADARSAPTLQS
jgi:hypothetical protein